MFKKKGSSAEIDMLNGSVWLPMLRFAVPLMLSSVLQLLYNAADVIVVGRFAGSTALAAVGSTGNVINLIITLLVGLSVGAGVVVAQRYGAGDTAGVQDAVHTSIAISLVGGLAFAVFGFFSSYTILQWMNSPADVIDQASLYMKVYFLGLPANMAYNFSASILRAVGDTKRPLLYLSVSGIVNVVLNLVLVIVFHLGVLGVAIATVVSQVLSALLTLLCLCRSDTSIRLFFSRIRFEKKTLGTILRIGIPTGLQSAMFSLANTLIQSAVNTFGSAVIAGCSAAGSIEGFVYVSQNAFSVTITNFAGQNVGARKYERLRSIMFAGMVMGFAVGELTGGLACIFSNQLLGIYTSDAQALAAGQFRVYSICILYGICSIMDGFSGQMRGMGCSTLPMLISLTGSCLLRIVWLNTIFKANPTVSVLYLVFPVSWISTSLIYVCFYPWVRKNLFRFGAVDGWGRGIRSTFSSNK